MKRALFIMTATVVVALGAAVCCIAAGDPSLVPAPEKAGTGFDAKLKLWQSLTPEEKEKLKRRFERLQKLTPEERARVMQNLKRFMSLPPEKREALLRLRAMMQKVPPQMRGEIRMKFGALMQMPPDRREQLMKRLGTVHELLQNDLDELKQVQPGTPEFHKALVEIKMKARLLNHLPPAELEKLKGMTSDQRDGELERLLHEGFMHPPHPRVPPMIRPGRPEKPQLEAPAPADPAGDKV